MIDENDLKKDLINALKGLLDDKESVHEAIDEFFDDKVLFLDDDSSKLLTAEILSEVRNEVSIDPQKRNSLNEQFMFLYNETYKDLLVDRETPHTGVKQFPNFKESSTLLPAPKKKRMPKGKAPAPPRKGDPPKVPPRPGSRNR